MQENYTPTPLIQNNQSLQIDKIRSESLRLSCFCWFFTICTWLFFFLIIYILTPIPDINWIGCEKTMTREKCNNYSLKDELSSTYIYIGIPFYIIYMFLEFCSPTYSFLVNKHTNKGLYAEMESLFKTRPTIIINCDCYHSETKWNTTYDSDGNSHTESENVNVSTYYESIPFNYYSCRDISGLFILNCDNKSINKKYLIKLEINEEINFADAISYYDYFNIRNDMKKRNEFKDTNFSLYNLTKIDGIKYHYLINIKDKEPRCVSPCWYFIFTIFALTQFYKWYISSLCIFQKFTIRKIISTRYDLGSDEFNEKYDKFNPQLNLITSNLTYQPNTYIYINPMFKKPLPSELEIKNAMQYEGLIPQYEICKENDEGKEGTVKKTSKIGNFNDDQINFKKFFRLNFTNDIPLITIKNDSQQNLSNEQLNNEITNNI